MADQPKLAYIPLANIRENPVALRPVDKTDSKYLELVDSVKVQGILNPFSVREINNPDPNGPQLYSVCDGLHRYTAACDAGLEQVPVMIVSKSDADVEEAQIVANIHKIDTKPAQYSKQLNRIVLRNPELTLTELSRRLSLSLTMLSERLTLVKLKETIQSKVDEGLIKLTNAVALAKLPVELQDDFVERAMTQSPVEFAPAVHNAVKQYRDAIRAGKDPNAAQVFTPVQLLQPLSAIKEAFSNSKPLAQELIALAQPKTPEDIFALGIAWCLRSDPKSVAAQKSKWEAEQADKVAKKAAAKAERDAKRAAAIAQTAGVSQTVATA